jgi:hypothetical protein
MDVFPKLKKKIHLFLVGEKGKISNQKLVSLGAFLGTASILSLLPEVAAAHTNSFTVSWSAGTITGTHAHHASHSSHGSHYSI